MPTASPIMSASRGAELDTGVTAVSAMIAPITMATPTSAETSGMPAARSEPKVMTSTTPAKSTPSTSMGVMPTVVSWNTCPANSTRESRPSPLAVRAASDSSVMSVAAPSSCTCTIATVPSSLTWSPANSSKGPSTFVTWSTSLTRSMSRSISSRTAGSSTLSPSGATTTACALAPETSGNSASRVSRASCDSVPGIVKVSSNWPPRASPPPSTPATTSAQAVMTIHARR